ncbi:uncharacterized protein LOC133814853 [Humulus lupulus]|uniref:uncharacterized protein LOC133814853 n=1 Tax=Humulus lupulus TaxID=3486 RepID=UPI002B409EC6|nr:uncharacterized protein LOC133814853 [Humulus lupulus]
MVEKKSEMKSVVSSDVVLMMSKITYHKLIGLNYLEWCKTVWLYLRSIDKDDHLTDDPPKEKDDSRQTWLREDARLFHQIWNSIDSEVIGLINHCESVKELMDYLEFLHSGKVNLSRMYEVCKAFYCVEKQDQSHMNYFMSFKKTYEELNMLLPFSPDVKVQQRQREQMAIMSFLAGLSPEFDYAKAQVLSGSDVSSLQDVFSRILCMEITHSVPLNSALESLKSSSPSVTAIADSGKSNTCLLSSSSKWVIDSGATDHMIGNSRLFSTFHSHTSTSTVTLADGHYYSYTPTYFDLMTKKIIGKGHESGGLYVLDIPPPTSFACSSVTSVFEAHCRLGHLSLPLLKKLCSQYSKIKNQFNVFIRTLQSDNAKECTSALFHSYMVSNGMLHETSCVDTTSQNGVAERKNRHLLETTRALLFQMYVPKHFWADAVSTACFLINRMPSSVLHGEIPYKILFPDRSLFPVNPRIFGSTCFARDVCPNVTKLDPKSLKCVFLGYSRLQKGYRCYCPNLNKYLVSIDVTFMENTPYFSSSSISTRQGEDDDDLLVYSITSSAPDPLPEESPIFEHISDTSRDESPITHPVSATTPDMPPPPIKVYTRHLPPVSCPTPASSLSDPVPSNDLPIALRKAISHPGWHDAMIEEMNALDDNGSWDLVDLPSGKRATGYSSLASTLARYQECFSSWRSSGGGVYGATSCQVVEKFGMLKSKFDHSVFYKRSTTGIILLVVYVDDIVIIGNDTRGISSLKSFIHTQFHTKDLGVLKNFLGVEITQSKQGKLGTKPCSTPMSPSVHLRKDGEPFEDPERYRRLVGKLNYLTVTRPDIAFSVSVVSQFMSSPTIHHWVALEQILCYLKGAPR